MKQFLFLFLTVLICFGQTSFAQIPVNTHVQIIKAEDERRWDSALENLLKSPNAKIRSRAALAAGRIGDERAISPLAALLKDASIEARQTAVFALGETESAKAADAVLETLKAENVAIPIRARALEAAGKIAAANPKDAKFLDLGRTIISVLEAESGRRSNQNREIVLLGITAILRARPEGGENVTAKFLDDPDAGVRADALNTLVRLRAKSVNAKARELLARDLDSIVRANAARMLGVGEDTSAVDLLLNVATKDVDSRVRVSAIRSLGSLKNTKILDQLLLQSSARLAAASLCESTPPTIKNVSTCNVSKSEFLEIAAILGRLLPNSNNQEAINFLVAFNEADKYQSPEIEIALARIAPLKFSELQKSKKDSQKNNWQAVNSMMAGIGELANAPDSGEIMPAKTFARAQVLAFIRSQLLVNQAEDKALPNALAAYAAFKPDDLPEVLRDAMEHRDPGVRASAAGLLADIPASKETLEVLKQAFIKSLLTDKRENDAQLAMLDALYKLDKKESVSSLLLGLKSPDYLVRQKAIRLIKNGDLAKDFPGIPSMLASAKTTVQPYAASTGTKLGQIFYTNADYIRAVSRKNGSVKAVFTTTKGNFTIDFFPEDAPLTVDNFVRLARSNYFNGLQVHRVVPNFVMQDGDPRGDGSGGPGWQIRCEINSLPYERGAVGMALSGKDTGGSQWFVTHSPQPHLDGGYTVFGKVNENEMKIVDSIVRGDKILNVRIIENARSVKR